MENCLISHWPPRCRFPFTPLKKKGHNDQRLAIARVSLATNLNDPLERFDVIFKSVRESKAYKKANLGYLSMGDSEIIERVIADPGLLRLPLVRFGNELTIGADEETWKAWQQAG